MAEKREKAKVVRKKSVEKAIAEANGACEKSEGKLLLSFSTSLVVAKHDQGK